MQWEGDRGKRRCRLGVLLNQAREDTLIGDSSRGVHGWSRTGVVRNRRWSRHGAPPSRAHTVPDEHAMRKDCATRDVQGERARDDKTAPRWRPPCEKLVPIGRGERI